MAREHFLCSAFGTDLTGNQRKFTVYKLRGRGFKICNDRGHCHNSHGSLTATERIIKSEIITVYNVHDVILEGSILQGVLASTWPLSCQHCANCGCAPTRRRYGGRCGG